MAAIYQQMPIRLQANLISSPPVTPIDANTGLTIKFWRAQGINVQVAIFDADGNIVDLSNLTYLQLQVQPASTSLVTSFTSTVNAGDLFPVIDAAKWRNGTAWQAQFILSAAQTDLGLGGASEAPYWLQLVGMTTGGVPIVYAAGNITVYNPGLPPSPPANLVGEDIYTNAGGSVNVIPDAQIYLGIVNVSGAPETRDIVVSAAGLVAGARISLLFNLPATAGINLRVFNQSTAGTLLTTISSQADGFLPTSLVDLHFDGANLKRLSLLQPAFGQQP